MLLFQRAITKSDNVITSQNQRIIIGGDLNVVSDPDLDCSRRLPKVKEPSKILDDICLNYDLIDIWRIRNPEIKRFTWRQKKSAIQRRTKISIKTGVRTDHSAIDISFNSLDEQIRALHIGI